MREQSNHVYESVSQAQLSTRRESLSIGPFLLTGAAVRGLEGDARRKTLSFVVGVLDECGDTAAERVKAYLLNFLEESLLLPLQ